MTTAQIKAKRIVARRAELYRRKKWLFYKDHSKRPAAERAQLRSKWWKLYERARRTRASLDRQLKTRVPLRERALAEARKLIGIMEVGGNNTGAAVMRIIRANGGTGPEPWCGDTMAFVFRAAGSKVVQRGWAAVRRLGFLTGMKIVREPEPGDIVCYTFDHTGMFVRWIDRAAGTFLAIEGNTGRTGAVSDSKTGGDGVYEKKRHRSQVSRWVRVTR